jgi:hypothetical protein
MLTDLALGTRKVPMDPHKQQMLAEAPFKSQRPVGPIEHVVTGAPMGSKPKVKPRRKSQVE